MATFQHEGHRPGVPMVAHLPPDLWAGICLHLSGEQLLRVALSGSKAIWSRLCSPGVVKKLDFGNDPVGLKRWPVLFNQLPTVEDIILDDRGGSEGWLIDWNPHLAELPKTLKSLSILVDEGKLQKFLFNPRFSSQIALASHLPRLESLTYPRSLISSYPRSLTSLTVRYWTAYDPLPETLLHFKTRDMGYPMQKKKGNFLPQHLKSLSIRNDGLKKELLPQLPKSLLVLDVFTEKFQTQNDLRCLPPLLTHIGFYGVDTCDGPVGLVFGARVQRRTIGIAVPSKLWKFLSPTLQTLEISGIVGTDAILDVQTPTKGRHGEVHHYRTFPIHLLPRNLTTLKLSFERIEFITWNSSELDDQDSTFFPPSLTHLELLGAQISVSVAKQLPHSIRTLSIQRLDCTTCEFLPRGLTFLHVTQALLSPRLIQNLPISLTYLHLGDVDESGEHCWIDPQSGRPISLSELKRLYSEEMDLEPYYIQKEFSWTNRIASLLWKNQDFWKDVCLPPNLTYLDMKHSRINETFFDQDLKHLRTLRLESVELTDRMIQRLPPSLKCLSSNKISGGSFKSLPRDLIALMADSSDITDEQVKELPRSLQILRIPGATRLSSECGQYFPRSLWYLDIDKNNSINSKIIPSLPWSMNRPGNYHRGVVFRTSLLLYSKNGIEDW